MEAVLDAVSKVASISTKEYVHDKGKKTKEENRSKAEKKLLISKAL